MSIGTFSELQTAIANWINRTDLTDRLPEFIALAEANFNRKLRVPQMEEVAESTLDSETVALPTDFLAVRSMFLDRNPRVELDYVPYGTLRTQFASTATGMPQVYTIADGAFWFGPASDASYNLEIAYWQKIPALSVSNTTNWLLTAHPDIYLQASLVHAAQYIRDDSAMAAHNAITEGLLAELAKSGTERAGGMSPLVARPRRFTWGVGSKGVSVKLYSPPTAPIWLLRILRRIEQSMGEPWDTPIRVQRFVVADLPAAADWPEGVIYVSNEAGGATLAFSDGTNWRRVQDRAIVS